MGMPPGETRLQIAHEIKQNEKPICAENTKATATTTTVGKLNWPKGLSFATASTSRQRLAANFEGEVSGKHC